MDWKVEPLQQLPACPYNQPATSHIPSPIPDSEMERIITTLCTSFDLDTALKLYDKLTELPTPRFSESRLTFPCIAFQLPHLSATPSRWNYTFRGDTAAFGMVEIKTGQDLSQMESLVLTHPWLDVILGCEETRSGASVEGEDEPRSPITDDENIDHNLPSLKPERPSIPAPVQAVPVDRETGARQLAARLRQSFGALLLVSVPISGENTVSYRRVAADSLITVQFREDVSLAGILDNVCVLNVI